MDSKIAHIVELAVADLSQAAKEVGWGVLALYPPMVEGAERPSAASRWTIETVDVDGNIYEHHGDTLDGAYREMMEWPGI
jgi:hypothetical protein